MASSFYPKRRCGFGPLPLEYCENGVKAVAWEITAHRCTPEFFAEHTVAELRRWDHYHLEQPGRLSHPLRYDAATDKYVPVSWGHAVEEIARDGVDRQLPGMLVLAYDIPPGCIGGY